ncbi:MAG: hypothetical protein ACI8PZ_004799 [Myxococcota bacterium]|jgi:hypothetical protein
MIVWALLLGCSGPVSADSAGPPLTTETAPPITPPILTVSTTEGGTASLTVDAVIPTVVRVDWSGADQAWAVTPYGATPVDRTGRFAVLGLPHGATVPVEVVLDRGGTLTTLDLGAVTLDPAPDPLPEWTITVFDADRSEVVGKHLLVAIQGNAANHAFIMDDAGAYVWTHTSDPHPYKITRARWSHDRRAVVFSQYDRSRSTDIGQIVRVPLDGSPRVDTRAPLQHHDFVEHDDGTYAWLTFAIEDREVENRGVLPVVGDGVRTGPQGAVDDQASTQMFRFLDDWGPAPWWTCAHFELDEWIPGGHDWNHTNSIAWEPVEDAWYVMSRHMDTMVKIDRSTGALLWTLSGPFSDFAMPDGGFHHAHFSQVLGPDHLLVFDNDLHTGETARVVEYRLDAGTGTAEVLWEQLDPEGEVTGYLGDAQRLPGGNTLIVWSPNGRVEEFTADGERVWQGRVPDGTVVGRVELVDDLYAGWR